jgi:hypothetical protein
LIVEIMLLVVKIDTSSSKQPPRRLSNHTKIADQLMDSSIDSNVAKKLAENFATVHNIPELDTRFIERVKKCLENCRCECKCKTCLDAETYCDCASSIDDVVNCVMADAYLSNSGRRLMNKRKRSFSSCSSSKHRISSVGTKLAGLSFGKVEDDKPIRKSSSTDV